MYLLNANTLQLEHFDNEVYRPQYAILSHRWQAEEITFQDMTADTANTKKGFHKLRMACKMTLWDGLDHIWIDTCCIDKSSSAELSEAINSMYRWYADATRCYVYLFDVSGPEPGHKVDFKHSVWFERSWTLQELIAPEAVHFYDRDWKEFGTKDSLRRELEDATGVPLLLLHSRNVQEFSVAHRMTWAAKRKATRKEDIAYSLMGIFDVNMPMLYGEGAKAFVRLQEEIIKKSPDQTILLWNSLDARNDTRYHLFARSPAEFNVPEVYPVRWHPSPRSFPLTNVGIEIEVFLLNRGPYEYLALPHLPVLEKHEPALLLRMVERVDESYVFVQRAATSIDWPRPYHGYDPERLTQITICSSLKAFAPKVWNGFVIGQFQDSHPFGDTVRITNVTIQGSRDSSDKYWTRSVETRDWVCTMEVSVTTSLGAEATDKLIFRLGFDFWSNPICLYWLDASRLLNASEDPAKMTLRGVLGDSDWDVKQQTKSVTNHSVDLETPWNYYSLLRCYNRNAEIHTVEGAYKFWLTMSLNRTDNGCLCWKIDLGPYR